MTKEQYKLKSQITRLLKRQQGKEFGSIELAIIGKKLHMHPNNYSIINTFWVIRAKAGVLETGSATWEGYWKDPIPYSKP
jgi:hypothetical protein